MMRSRFLGLLSALLAVATVLAGCGGDVAPRSLVKPRPADRPMPAGVHLDPEVPEAESGSDCGDPTASLAPRGLTIPPGSTMEKIRKRGRLIAGVDQNTYLFGFRNPTTGELEGFDIDIVREIAEKLLGDRNKVQFKALPTSKRMDALKDGSVDLVAYTMTVTCDRRKEAEFSSVYFESGQRILVPKGSDYTEVSDLGNKPVCVPAGSTSLVNLAKMSPPPDLVAVDDLADCLLLLQQRQVEAVSTDDSVLAGMARQDPSVHVVGEPFSKEPYAIGIPKKNIDMVRYVNAVLEEIRKDSWDDIYHRWLEPALGPATPPAAKYK
ncbi:glutamate ABC transporter substrate-binding protein [Thermocrispum sp.]|uniref:glutamate ABC transporter substrate-binding protein n=1 Tax=Thermocrispum sp. TaxID=2060768 RepID=UPI00338D8BA6